jgi:hypothetical protein
LEVNHFDDIKNDANNDKNANNQTNNMNWVFQIHSTGKFELVAAFRASSGLCGDI